MPEAKLRSLSILPASEIEQQLIEWNATAVDYPKDKCVHELFEEQVEKSPAQVAVVYEDRELSYGELNEKSNQLAHYLIEQGVKPDSLVGLCVERSLEMVIGLLGILKAGGAYVPLDPNYPEKRIAFMLEDSEVELILSQSNLFERLSVSGQKLVCISEHSDELVRTSNSTNNISKESIELVSSNLAYVIYTSGSTGLPKGVMVTHCNAVNFLSCMEKTLEINSEDKLLAVTTLSFDISLLELCLPLYVGAEVNIASREVAISGELLSERIQTHGISVLQATPITWEILLETKWQGMPELKALIGGESFSLELATRLLPKVKALWNMYGPTETTVWSTLHQFSESDVSVAIGRPIYNTDAYVLNKGFELNPVGVPGELYIGGTGLSQGYLNQPGLTAERFVPHPFSQVPGARLYRTGDLVRYLEGGVLEFLQRIDQQVKVRGFRIELGEVEAQLLRLDEIKEAVVLVRELGNDRQLVAYIVTIERLDARDEESKEVEARKNNLISILRAKLGNVLPDYMVPRVCVVLDQLPLTPNGKVDKKALPQPGEKDLQKEVYVAPQNEVEEKLCEIWREILNLEQIGTTDNFFSIGGQSILAVRVVSCIREEFGVELELGYFFVKPTIAQISEEVILEQQVISDIEGFQIGLEQTISDEDGEI